MMFISLCIWNYFPQIKFFKKSKTLKRIRNKQVIWNWKRPGIKRSQEKYDRSPQEKAEKLWVCTGKAYTACAASPAKDEPLSPGFSQVTITWREEWWRDSGISWCSQGNEAFCDAVARNMLQVQTLADTHKLLKA